MSAAPSDLRVPKHAVQVELALDGAEPRAVELFLAAQRAHDPRPEDVLELLGAAQAFLPARDLATDTLELLAKDAIVWVAVPPASDDVGGDLYDERRAVRVELRGGQALDGELLYSPPQGRGRVVDHLNEDGRFVRLSTDGRVTFVGKRHIVRVVERDPEWPRSTST